jgi:hypothetical protein
MIEMKKKTYSISEAKKDLTKIVSNLTVGEPITLYNAKEKRVVAEIVTPRKKGVSFNYFVKDGFKPSSVEDIMSSEFDEEIIGGGDW